MIVRCGCAVAIVSVWMANATAYAGAEVNTAGRYATLTSSHYIDHIKILAGNAFEGRGTGSAGNDRAAEYISRHFAEYGLQPMGTEGWYQPFDVHARKTLNESAALFEVEGLDAKWQIRRDWIPFPMSAMEEVETAKQRSAGALPDYAKLAEAVAGLDKDTLNYSFEGILDANGSPVEQAPEPEEPAPPPGGGALASRVSKTRNTAAAKTPDRNGVIATDGALEAPLAFAGFGIAAEEHDYDDYKHFNVEGKAVIVFRYEPKAEDPESKFGGKSASAHATFIRKCRVAADRGAVAVIIVNPPDRDDSNPDDLYPFDTENTRTSYRVPLIQIKRDVADAILAKAGAPTLSELHAECQAGKQASRDLNLTMRLKTGLQYLKTRNVIGYLPGDGSTDEIVVVGSHFDHEGIKPPGFYRAEGPPAIHNGADDNASGTAGMLELARTLSAGPKLRRNLLFIAFAGEEMGLLGSRHFVEHPTVGWDRIRAMMNFDMIGRYGQGKFEIWGTSTAAEYPELVERIADRQGLEYKAPRSKDLADLFGRSDHAPFFEKGVPVMFPFTGVHRDYHRPEDDWELIDAEGAVRVLDLARDVLVEIANMREGPTFIGPEEKTDAPEAAPDADVADSADADEDPAPPRRGGRARIGFMPAYGDDSDGVLVETVTSETAKAAGLRDGDRLLRIEEIDIAGMRDYMTAMSGREPGQVIKLVVERDGKQVTLEVPLAE